MLRYLIKLNYKQEGERTLNLSGIWDWAFFWDSYGFFLKTVANFLMIIVAIIAVGLLLRAVIGAIRSRGT